MRITTEPVSIKHRVGDCPACQYPVWADVRVATEVSDPQMSRDGKATVYATPYFKGMTVAHRCERNEDGAWEWLPAVVAGETNRIHITGSVDGSSHASRGQS